MLTSIRFLGGLQAMELRLYDSLLSLRPSSYQSTPVVLIRETETDIDHYGYPLSDERLAQILEKLLALNARVIGIDKYRDIPVPPGSDALNKVLSGHDNLFWIFFIGDNQQGSIAPPAILKDSAQMGFNDLVNDPDGVSRRGLLFLDDNGSTHYSFPLLIALKYLAAEHITAQNDNQYLRLNKTTFLPLETNSGGYATIDAAGYQFLLTYPHLDRYFPSFTITELLTDKIPPQAIKDKIVLLGAMAPSLSDYKLFPNGVQHYGVELHGHIIDQLLQTAQHDYSLIRYWSKSIEYSYILLWCLLGGLASLWHGGMLRLSLISSGGLVLLFFIAQRCFIQGWWLPLLPSSLAWLGSFIISVMWSSTQERMERRQLLQLFERHVSKQVVSTLWAQRDEFFSHGGVKPDQLTATVLFTDLVNFTSVAETMQPLTLMNWLNDYMDAMSAILIEENGMINKYIGDAIMTVFGAPVKRRDEAGIANDAISAVESALRMGERLRELNQVWQAQDLPVIEMRVGIYTGSLVAGTLGGQQRMEYTVIGDTVNIASRLESYDKNFSVPDQQNPCRILIGESTWQYIRDYYRTEKVGAYQLKGKHNILNIYQVLNRLTSSSQGDKHETLLSTNRST
ncbi:MAG: adenylate/guanylate cyclase domain-containing protein [Methylococcaceae bacterium]